MMRGSRGVALIHYYAVIYLSQGVGEKEEDAIHEIVFNACSKILSFILHAFSKPTNSKNQ